MNEIFLPVVSEGLDAQLDSICPAFIGITTISGKTLRSRTPRLEVTVTAPSSYLNIASNLLDGTRTFREVLAALPRSIDVTKFERFLVFLLQKGVVGDGRLLTVHALQYGFQASPYGVSAPPHETDRISRRFADAGQRLPLLGVEPNCQTSLVDQYRDRISTYTFDETAVSFECMAGLLWSLCGIVDTTHERLGKQVPRRTIASAGALHLLQVYLVLQRASGEFQPGVYRVHYPDAGAVALEPIGTGHDSVARAFTQPWHLQFAAGVIFLAADAELAATRYRNRALQYLFMEAGAALHNGALNAPQLGLGFATLGCYYETVVQELCQLHNELILGSAIFGPKPTHEQLKQLQRAPNLEFAWVDRDSPIFSPPLYLARANLKTAPAAADATWGTDANPWIAYRKAAAESIERQGQREPRDLCLASLLDLPSALPPESFIRYGRHQYAQTAFPFQPFQQNEHYWWKEGTEYGAGKSVWIHADLVYLRSALVAHATPAPQAITYATTSGCAAGATEGEAFERALFELVERDAFMRCWLAQAPGKAISPTSAPSYIQSRIKALRESGCEVGIQTLPSRWSNVLLVWAQHHDNHFTTLGTASHDDIETALSSALAELETRVFAWLSGHQADPSLRPRAVKQTADHFNLYGLQRYFLKADRILKATNRPITLNRATMSAPPLDRRLQDRFVECGLSPVLVNITPEKCFIDQGRTKLSVVKAFVPSLVPLPFGYHLEPAGMVDFVHAGARFPHPFP